MQTKFTTSTNNLFRSFLKFSTKYKYTWFKCNRMVQILRFLVTYKEDNLLVPGNF